MNEPEDKIAETWAVLEQSWRRYAGRGVNLGRSPEDFSLKQAARNFASACVEATAGMCCVRAIDDDGHDDTCPTERILRRIASLGNQESTPSQDAP